LRQDFESREKTLNHFVALKMLETTRTLSLNCYQYSGSVEKLTISRGVCYREQSNSFSRALCVLPALATIDSIDLTHTCVLPLYDPLQAKKDATGTQLDQDEATNAGNNLLLGVLACYQGSVPTIAIASQAPQRSLRHGPAGYRWNNNRGRLGQRHGQSTWH
jgi:hypothetical protein